MTKLEQTAALSFEAMVVDLQPKARFMAGASGVYEALRLTVGMLGKGPDEMTAGFRSMIEATGDDGAAAVASVRDITDAREWLTGFADVLASVEARCLIALSRVAVEKAA